ncbi:MAG: YgjV family protein [Clostridia bacterium]|nr:YgjV family protein [Clostridia bacterium]
MTREQWAFVISIVVMVVMCSSYFVKNKSLYLIVQGVGITLLMVSYILWREYFAMVGLVIGLVRMLVYLLYEQKNKETPIWWAIVFSVLGVACYLIINLWIQGTAKWVDIIYLVGLVAYAFVFRIRNLNWVRYLVLIPTGLSILYNALLGAGTLMVVISYSFEFCANLVSIVKYHVWDKKKQNVEEKEDEEGEDSSVDTLG